ncbi:MAG: uroporphyrinogen decarboxylase family protein [Chloroflexota bacterium]
MSQMTHRERIVATLAGTEVDRPAISLWRHFGGIDMTSDGLADAMIGFQRQFDFDFVKFMPTGTYTIIDWGAETAWEPNDTGIRAVKRLPVRAPEDWADLTELDTSAGVLGMVNAALTRTVKAVGPQTPVLQTIFSPLTTARKLGGPATLAHIRQDPDAFAVGLATIERVTARLIADAVERGADIFYAVQSGTADILTRDEFESLERAPADRLLGSLPPDTIVLLHSHGDHLWFDEVAAWDVDAVNWHDRTSGPPMDVARRRTTRAFVGGIDAWTDLRSGTTADVTERVHEALDRATGVVVGPGCVIPTDAAVHLVSAARQAVESWPARRVTGGERA